MNNKIIKDALLHAVLTALYVSAVASFLFYVPRQTRQVESVLIPIMMLSLFVFSAAVTGLLVLGRPILWYLDGKKKEALSLLVATLAIFFVITIAIFFALYAISL